MRNNMDTCLIGKNVFLMPYTEYHVRKYNAWMKCPTLRYLTGSDCLTLDEEYEMQDRWVYDKTKCAFIILEKSIYLATANQEEAMIGGSNIYFNYLREPRTAEIEIMIADPAHRHKKRGWEAIIIMMRYGVNELNIDKYHVKIKMDNPIAVAMFKKLGFFESEKCEMVEEVTLTKISSKSWMNWLYSEQQSLTVTDLHDSNEL